MGESIHPKFVKQWHPTKNGTLKPEYLSRGSGKKVWWKCDEGPDHEWEASPDQRNNSGSCPFCSNRRVSVTNSLKTLSPKLAKEWHPSKNGDLGPEKIINGSGKKVWWKCNNGPDHEWEASPDNRKRNGCPFCSNYKISMTNSLVINAPQVAQEWHPSKNGELRPEQFTIGSQKKVWWKCDEGPDHEWEARIDYRTRRGFGCTICSSKKIVKSNNFETLFPEIAKEWHPTKNGKLRPNQFAKSATSKRIWWQCSRFPGHIWRTTIGHRTSAGTGCPHCTNQTSQEELRIFSEILAVFPSALSRKKFEGIELDIYLPAQKLGIEYDGCYYHQNRAEADINKNEKLTSAGVQIIRVREKPLQKIGPDDFLVKKGAINKELINLIIVKIYEKIGLTPNELARSYLEKKTFQNVALYKKYLSYYPNPFPENAVASDDVLVAQWDWARNHPITPENLSKGSSRAVWWTCDKGPDHKWEAPPSTRARSGCPFCAGRAVSTSNSLADKNPEIAAQWHEEKNGDLKSSNFVSGSHKKVWWKCDLGPDHEWKASIANRVAGNGCPFCNGKKTSKTKSIASLYPELAREWNNEKNFPLLPEHVLPKSDRLVWWKCQHGHEWEIAVKNRVMRNSPCPICRSLAWRYPELAVEWHPTKNGNLTALDVNGGSGKKHWWQCRNNTEHTWQATPDARSRGGKKCPFCG